MKKSEIKIGTLYVAKISGNLVPVRIDSESMFGGWNATNTITNRVVRIRSAAKLRREYIIVARTPVERIALMFSRLLRRQLTVDQMRQVILLNATETNESTCHSHDFCDANMVMHDAFVKCGMEPPNVDDQATVDTWNAAWKLAVEKTFYMEPK